ncbi:carbohydrate diacid regulator [Aequitasia blattaphilus]|uniref:Helix-turn-helix domain-containing protein n=1 Tax=Aequitasia blattaphilus TaxID=2949332 RepID=A0ABT1E8H4_9FIRM|nr:sugar diacid recognition domain-containing protein [Aequitasia blattaphilus]MCP1102133.1 helix-turn-helix domain-containing protein [Aequitasia blattaphilus]MCR8614773.1 helix-turn-helix domain-containing protein [Aequitasia blattaphilus]
MEISKHLANQIVEATHKVVGNRINLINHEGLIIASTDTKRVSTFHEAGFQAIETKKSVIVNRNSSFKGTKEGINYPILLNKEAVGAIGISGNPDEVKKYGVLVTKITEVFLKEQLLELEMNSKERLYSYVITSLIHNNIREGKHFYSLLEKLSLDVQASYCVLSIQILEGSYLSSVEHFFHLQGITLFTYTYPNELIVLLSQEQMNHFNRSYFDDSYRGYVYCGEGTAQPLLQASRSYHQALVAQKYAKHRGLTLCSSKDITAHLIYESIPQDLKETYIHNILGHLEDRELELLKAYFSNNLSLVDTAKELNIHKNTLQYRLDKIREKAGFNPRLFQDAYLLNLALSLI